MKKSVVYLMVMLLSLIALPTQMAAAEKDTIPTVNNPKEMSGDVKVKLARLEEIKAMDKSDLSPSEIKALRKESKTIKASLKKSNGTNVYFAVGALIIILIVLVPLATNI